MKLSRFLFMRNHFPKCVSLYFLLLDILANDEEDISDDDPEKTNKKISMNVRDITTYSLWRNGRNGRNRMTFCSPEILETLIELY